VLTSGIGGSPAIFQKGFSKYLYDISLRQKGDALTAMKKRVETFKARASFRLQNVKRLGSIPDVHRAADPA
jgi:hypothetical protein